jgi:hypothetical protein
VQLDFPFQFDSRGRTASATDDEHVRDLIEQVLFTTPGERVNRPTFGSGLMQLTFSPASDELTTATEFLVQSALQQWLAGLVAVERVDVTTNDGTLEVVVEYRIRREEQRRSARFVRQVT